MRELAAPGLAKFNQRLAEAGLPRAVKFISALNGANADFMAYALSPAGPLAGCRAGANPDSVEACLADLLIYAVNLFARDEMRRDTSELIPLLARIVDISPTRVMLKRDNLSKAPHSAEWMLYTWLVRNLTGEAAKYDPELERGFGYQYLSYIGQYREIIERELNRADPE
jgi:hypothetical protein